MPSINAIRIRRYNRLCKSATRILEEAKHRGFATSDLNRLTRIENIMADLNSRISTGPRGAPGTRQSS